MAKKMEFNWLVTNANGHVIAATKWAGSAFKLRDHLNRSRFPGYPFTADGVERQEVIVQTEWFEQASVELQDTEKKEAV